MDELRITAADDADLSDLRRWLAGAGVPMRTSAVAPGAEAGSGVLEALVTVLTDETMLTALTTGVVGWLAARMSHRRTRLRLRHGDREIEVDTARSRDLDELAAWLRGQLDDRQPPSDPAERPGPRPE